MTDGGRCCLDSGAFGAGTIVDTPVYLAGDLNCDGDVDGEDVQAFVTALLNPGGYPGQFPLCSPCAGDMNADGTLSGLDAAGFVSLLVAP